MTNPHFRTCIANLPHRSQTLPTLTLRSKPGGERRPEGLLKARVEPPGVGVTAEGGAASVFLYADRSVSVRAVCTVHDSAKMKP